MGIRVKKSLVHWNYFLALESDLVQVSRYIEFVGSNFRTYSIELSHLLLAASSEIDVIAKATCNYLVPTVNAKNIVDYRNVITGKLPEYAKQMVYVPRFNLKIKPWYHWTQGKTPSWWDSYNKVKHERNEYFAQANLKNVLYSMGGLLVAEFYFHKLKFQAESIPIRTNKDVTALLIDEPSFLRLPDEYYSAVISWD